MKKLKRSISFMLVICMLFTATVTTVYAGEPIRNMTYEEWLEEQKENSQDSDIVEADMEPVRVEPEKNIVPQIDNEEKIEDTEFRTLDSIFEETGRVELEKDITENKISEETTNSISRNNSMLRTAPTARLLSGIINEDSLIDDWITTDTLILFIYNDSDADSDTIVKRYVGGSASNFILGEVDGGFVMHITTPGTYNLYYMVEDSTGEQSDILVLSIVVLQAVSGDYQVFEDSFHSAEDSVTYNFSIDFTKMNSAAVCLVRKGYIGTAIKVYDESGKELIYTVTGSRKPKAWAYIDKPSANATICNYTLVATPKEYENRASDYRITIGDRKDTELMMSGIQNTVLLEQYYEAKVNLQNNYYFPNVGEYWFKFRGSSTNVVTILSKMDNIRFKVLEADTLYLGFDSAEDSDTHKTSFTGISGAWTRAEKARLVVDVGKEYYLVVYCTEPKEYLEIKEGTMTTAVGNPIMCADSFSVSPGIPVTATPSKYSTVSTFNVSGKDIPLTAQVISVSLAGTTMSHINKWKLMDPYKLTWRENSATHSPTIDYMFIKDSANNVKLVGKWSVAFQSGSSSYTFTPSYSFLCYYEYGDE